MAHRKRFPPCTHCGATSDKTRSTTTFAANDGELPGWDLKCGWCGEHYLAVMIPLPAYASMSALDDGLRERRRNDKRRKYGYELPPAMSSRGAKRIESATIQAVVRILPGRVVAGLRKRLGPARWTPMTIGSDEQFRMVPYSRKKIA